MTSLHKFIKFGILWFGAILKRNHSSKVIYYHDVYQTTNYKALDADIQMGTPLSLFKQHIQEVRKQGYEIVPRITKPTGQVAIMFDDGFRGLWECRQYFYDNKICPTVFLPVGFIGRTDLGILSLDEIKELQNHGFIFQCHTWSHRPLTVVPKDELQQELIDSKKKLTKILDSPVNALCMPLGYFTPKLIEKIKAAGYEEIYSCIPGSALEAPHGMLARNLVQSSSPLEVKLILQGANDMLKNRYYKLHCKENEADSH